MTNVLIDPETCTACGACVKDCPAQVFGPAEGGPPPVVRADHCIRCGHCAAICPVDAVTLATMDMNGFVPVDRDATTIEPDRLRGFLRRRRSVRQYQEKPVPREVLAELIEMGRYAPSGENAMSVHYIVVDDRDAIQRLAQMTVAYYEKIIGQLGNPLLRTAYGVVEDNEVVAYALASLPGLQDLVDAQRAGRDRVFHSAPALLILHGPRGDTTAYDNCVYALYNIVLLAESLGLGTCINGYFPAACQRDKAIRHTLELPEKHRVYAACTLGYPRVRYRRLVDRAKPTARYWPE
jgi:nitroreductase/NAD-dependent dihydropyrimidine dehydrogenase PreA subunit